LDQGTLAHPPKFQRKRNTGRREATQSKGSSYATNYTGRITASREGA